MENGNNQNHPKIVKYVEASRSGIESVTLSRCAIGYILHGTKNIYYGDKRYRISRGEIFYLGVGRHYIENMADDDKEFEQIIFYYTPSELQQIMSQLNITYGVSVSNGHSCEVCSSRQHVSMPATNAMKSFFQSCSCYLRNDFFSSDVAENIKMTELIYMLVSCEDCCLKSKLLSNMDVAQGNFDRIIYSNMFNDISIEQLASASNRSLTSFKKEFKRRFNVPPHKWYIRQRLAQSQLMLISTSKSVSEIGVACSFPNTSHFIKLFKKEYNTTPAAYRQNHFASRSAEQGVIDNLTLGDTILDSDNTKTAVSY
ncbi:MAG: helix-turn-helix transcriptional regulator [Alistipes sp.]|nr:helix-turn-helix transcriptional regulator [Alistipes sp.]